MLEAQPPGERELLSEREVFSRYGLSLPWLRKYRRLRSGPPFVRLGKMVKYLRRDLDEFLERHVVAGHSESR